VEAGLGLRGLARQQEKRKFRAPDNLANAAEELEKLTKRNYQKLSGSRRIGPHLKLDATNTSRSFAALIDGIQRVCKEIKK
jgi:hypothetical protein